MKNDLMNSNSYEPALTVDRRRFLQSAVGASMAIAATGHAQSKHPIASNAVIRVGLIGRDGHREILLSSIPKLANVQWTAYAKGNPGKTALGAKAIPRQQPNSRV